LVVPDLKAMNPCHKQPCSRTQESRWWLKKIDGFLDRASSIGGKQNKSATYKLATETFKNLTPQRRRLVRFFLIVKTEKKYKIIVQSLLFMASSFRKTLVHSLTYSIRLCRNFSAHCKYLLKRLNRKGSGTVTVCSQSHILNRLCQVKGK